MPQRLSHQVNGYAQQHQNGAAKHHGFGPPALYQVAGDKARRKHTQHMPLDHYGRVGKVMAMVAHSERSGTHDQIHNGVTDHAREQCSDVVGLQDNLQKRSGYLRVLFLGIGFEIDKEQQYQGQAIEQRQAVKGSDKGRSQL